MTNDRLKSLKPNKDFFSKVSFFYVYHLPYHDFKGKRQNSKRVSFHTQEYNLTSIFLFNARRDYYRVTYTRNYRLKLTPIMSCLKKVLCLSGNQGKEDKEALCCIRQNNAVIDIL